MTREISNSDDVIDSRDVIARIEELEGEREDHVNVEGEPLVDGETWDQAQPELAAELATLKKLASEAADYCADWEYGESLIRDSYFKTYAQDLADDCDAIPKDLKWPLTCIDWDQAARELRYDYTSVDFDGVTYWVRS